MVYSRGKLKVMGTPHGMCAREGLSRYPLFSPTLMSSLSLEAVPSLMLTCNITSSNTYIKTIVIYNMLSGVSSNWCNV
jgi:hypothetical protein